MKITTKYLQRIIKEELTRILNERFINPEEDPELGGEGSGGSFRDNPIAGLLHVEDLANEAGDDRGCESPHTISRLKGHVMKWIELWELVLDNPEDWVGRYFKDYLLNPDRVDPSFAQNVTDEVETWAAQPGIGAEDDPGQKATFVLKNIRMLVGRRSKDMREDYIVPLLECVLRNGANISFEPGTKERLERIVVDENGPYGAADMIYAIEAFE